MTEPAAPPPEDRDWTSVITDGCPECGFVPFDATLAPARVRAAASAWRTVLAGDSVRDRPSALVWSPLEYGCHVRDVCHVMTGRVELVRDTDGAQFANWDQDATAIAERYWEQDPATVADEIAAAADHAAVVLEQVPGNAWTHRGIRSNGSEFTLATLAVYFLHDVEHHLHDVGA